MISSTRPTLLRAASVGLWSRVSVLASKVVPPYQRSALGPGDDFHDFLGDLRLALAVHLERQVVDQLGRVL